MTLNLPKHILQGAAIYADYDQSDPFTATRILCHTLNGIAGMRQDDLSLAFYHGEASHFEAEYQRPDGTIGVRFVTTYRNLQRP